MLTDDSIFSKGNLIHADYVNHIHILWPCFISVTIGARYSSHCHSSGVSEGFFWRSVHIPSSIPTTTMCDFFFDTAVLIIIWVSVPWVTYIMFMILHLILLQSQHLTVRTFIIVMAIASLNMKCTYLLWGTSCHCWDLVSSVQPRLREEE